jgi:hypothetical protein
MYCKHPVIISKMTDHLLYCDEQKPLSTGASELLFQSSSFSNDLIFSPPNTGAFFP